MKKFWLTLKLERDGTWKAKLPFGRSDANFLIYELGSILRECPVSEPLKRFLSVVYGRDFLTIQENFEKVYQELKNKVTFAFFQDRNDKDGREKLEKFHRANGCYKGEFRNTGLGIEFWEGFAVNCCVEPVYVSIGKKEWRGRKVILIYFRIIRAGSNMDVVVEYLFSPEEERLIPIGESGKEVPEERLPRVAKEWKKLSIDSEGRVFVGSKIYKGVKWPLEFPSGFKFFKAEFIPAKIYHLFDIEFEKPKVKLLPVWHKGLPNEVDTPSRKMCEFGEKVEFPPEVFLESSLWKINFNEGKIDLPEYIARLVRPETLSVPSAQISKIFRQQLSMEKPKRSWLGSFDEFEREKKSKRLRPPYWEKEDLSLSEELKNEIMSRLKKFCLSKYSSGVSCWLCGKKGIKSIGFKRDMKLKLKFYEDPIKGYDRLEWVAIITVESLPLCDSCVNEKKDFFSIESLR